MRQSTFKNFRSCQAAFALAIGLVVGTASTPAAAASSVAAPPSQVEYFGNPSQVMIVINGVMYVGKLGAPGCGGAAQTVDTLKTWASMAQAALLSGKKLLVWYDTGGSCGTNKYIASLVIQS